MTHTEQVNQFSDELDRLVERFRSEYDLDYASMIGCLHLKVHFVSQEAYEEAEEEPGNPSGEPGPEGGS